jgi:hypothetical protein
MKEECRIEEWRRGAESTAKNSPEKFRGHSVIVNPPGHLISVQPAHHSRVALRSGPGEGGCGDSRSNPVKVSQTSSGSTESHSAGANCMQILYHECLTALTKFHPVKVSQTGSNRFSLQSNSSKSCISGKNSYHGWTRMGQRLLIKE